MVCGLQQQVPFDARMAEAQRIRTKYPDRVPVICERAPRSDLPVIEKRKFLVPGHMLCGELKYVIHKYVMQSCEPGELNAMQTIYLSVNNTSPKSGTLMWEIYDQYRAEDGFVYFIYSAENTLG